MTDGKQPTQPSDGEGAQPTPPPEGAQPAKDSGSGDTEGNNNPPASAGASEPASPAPSPGPKPENSPSPTQQPQTPAAAPGLSNEEKALADAEPTISMPGSPAQQTPDTSGTPQGAPPGPQSGSGAPPAFGAQQPPAGMPGGPVCQGPGQFAGQPPTSGPTPQGQSPQGGPGGQFGPGAFGQAPSGPSKNKKVALIAGIIGVVVLVACGIGGYFLYQNISTDNAHQKGKCIVKDGDKAEPADCDDDGAVKINKRVNDTTDPEKCPAKDTEEVFINETNDYILCLKKA